jgi:predicted transcriptional regulator
VPPGYISVLDALTRSATSSRTKENVLQRWRPGPTIISLNHSTRLRFKPESVSDCESGLQTALANRVKELEKALLELTELRAQLSIPL